MRTLFKNRAFIFSILATALLFFAENVSRAADAKKPNIIFILADDLGYGDVGCFGQKLIKTPNIDKLSIEGTKFTQAYAGSTVCAPSRCTLMTGLHTGHARIRSNSNTVLLPEDVTVAKLLKGAGYSTGLTGKWGLGNENTTGEPKNQGFDFSFGYLDQTHAHDYWTDHLFKNGERISIPPKTYSHDLMEKEALDFIRREQKNPFFLYAAFTLPHMKFEPPNDEPYSKENWSSLEKNLAAMVTRLDNTVGKITALLKELGLEENTLIFFTSDNGARENGAEFFKSSGPLRGFKRDLYEGGFREPMIVRWPGKIKAGATNDQVWAFWDFLPTVAEIVGVKAPKNLDGKSMLPALLGKKKIEHEPLYWEFYERGFQQAVRMGNWKAVRLAPGQPLELYNLANDIGETKNVAAENPKVIEKIERYLATARTHHPKEPSLEPKKGDGGKTKKQGKAKK